MHKGCHINEIVYFQPIIYLISTLPNLPACLPECAIARIPEILPACPPSCLPSSLPAFLPVCPPTCLPSYLPAFQSANLPDCLPKSGKDLHLDLSFRNL
jgi:hypothetical protein